MYYLQSRYYDPEVCRFINADEYASTGQGFLGYNMFAYCNNNPANCMDECGTEPISISIAVLAGAVLYALVSAVIASPGFQKAANNASKAIAGYVDRAKDSASAIIESIPDKAQDLLDDAKNALSKAKDFARSITTRSDRYVVHHIVAQEARAAAPARSVLESVGINPRTNGLNLAVIPERYHTSMHTANYYNYVNGRFYGLEGNKYAVIATLAELQIEIQLYCHTGIKNW